MKYLLDTHVLLWWLFDDRRLSKRVRALVADRNSDLLISAASAWEISTKYRLGRLPSAKVLVENIPEWIKRAGFLELPVSVAHAQRAGGWHQAHRDPFDRMLAAQSAIEELPLISNDGAMETFGIATVW